MFKTNAVRPLVEQAPPKVRTGGAVDHIAAANGALILALGVTQLAAPDFAAPLTGIEAGTGAEILGLQWAALGALLAIGGIIRTRVVSIFAAEFVMISAIAALAVTLVKRPDAVPLLIHGSVLFLGLISSGFARLTDKAELKRELRLIRELVSVDHDSTSPSAKESNDG